MSFERPKATESVAESEPSQEIERPREVELDESSIETETYEAERAEKLDALRQELLPKEETEQEAPSREFVSERKDPLEGLVIEEEELAEHLGVTYPVKYASRESLFPAFGFAYGREGEKVAVVRNDLPPRVRAFVKQHELYHLGDEKLGQGGWLMDEFRANFYPGLRDPIGLVLTIAQSLRQEGRFTTYKQLFMKQFAGRDNASVSRIGRLGAQQRKR